MSNSNVLQHRLTTSKARSHCVLRPAQFGRKLVLGTRRKWPRPRRDRVVCFPRPRRDQDVDIFSRDETETRRRYVSRPSGDRNVETETTTLPLNRGKCVAMATRCQIVANAHNDVKCQTYLSNQ